MPDLADKISSYNVFNYLLPGTLFAHGGSALSSFDLVFDNIFAAAFIYYFYGMVISRIGSLAIEPLLKRFNFLEFADYDDFVSASLADPKIETLSEVNNTYRSILSMLMSLPLLFLVDRLSIVCPSILGVLPGLFVGLLVILFAIAYRKQTNFVRRRVERNLR